ncbi:FAD-binding protein [Tomitella biformata]|uniref:FAD-binding protein n=1 Tax=Tomitella biformata TaxID=630403 RepID=UPI00130E794F|nr:FAD-binding protein [Tomitella biformata]
MTTEFDEESLSGRLLWPGDAGFEDACNGFNRTSAHLPALVVMARSAADVAAAVRSAHRAGLQVQVHGTGHGMGVPSDGGVLVDTAEMRAVSIDPQRRTATVAAGALWSDVIGAASPTASPRSTARRALSASSATPSAAAWGRWAAPSASPPITCVPSSSSTRTAA